MWQDSLKPALWRWMVGTLIALGYAVLISSCTPDEVTIRPSHIAAETAEVPAAPAKPALTLEEVRAVLADKSRAGHTAEIRELLKKYGASKLSLVDPKHYEALLREAEVL